MERQRFSNPLKDAVAGLPNVAWRDRSDVAKSKRMTHIQYALYPPADGVRPLLGDLARAGWRPEVEVLSAPEFVFAQYKCGAGGEVCAVHLLNYEFQKPVSGIRLRLPEGVVPVFSAPFEVVPHAEAPREIEPGVWELPAFARYAYCTLARRSGAIQRR